ncbi:MAG: extracellular solute-binding protein [Clostridiales bacterium]
MKKYKVHCFDINKKKKMEYYFIVFIVLLSINTSLTSCETDEKSNLKIEEKIDISIWHIWAEDTETQKKTFEKTLDDYQKENAKINFEVEAYENETYKNKIKTAIAVNEAPDIFFTWGAGFARPFIRANSVMEMDNYLDEKTLEKLKIGSLDYFTYDDKIYGLPMYSWAAILYCNKELFNKNNIKIPDTYNDLVKAVEEFNKKGIVAITAGEKERWPGVFFQNILAIRVAGIDKCNAVLKNKESFNQNEFIKSTDRLIELVKKKSFDKNIIKLTKDEAEHEFKLGNVAMYYMGNWSVASWEAEDSPIKGKIVCKNFPSIYGESGDQEAFLGGAIETFMISERSSHKKESMEAVKYISKNMSDNSNYIGYGIPAWKGSNDKSKLSPMNEQVYNLISDDTKFALAWDTILEGGKADVYKNYVTKIFTEELSSAEFVESMEELINKN